jgi:hypothetical protein
MEEKGRKRKEESLKESREENSKAPRMAND